MSPSTSQQWDFETLSALSQPAVPEEIAEEPDKFSCWRSTKTRFAAAGRSLLRIRATHVPLLEPAALCKQEFSFQRDGSGSHEP